jgi:acyl-CoA synthetase (AMP-forming)/AMP-acid ligase II
LTRAPKRSSFQENFAQTLEKSIAETAIRTVVVTGAGGLLGLPRGLAFVERWKAVTGKPLIEAYGLTETSPPAVAKPLTVEDDTGAIGWPLPWTDIAIRDPQGSTFPLAKWANCASRARGHGRLLESAGRDE